MTAKILGHSPLGGLCTENGRPRGPRRGGYTSVAQERVRGAQGGVKFDASAWAVAPNDYARNAAAIFELDQGHFMCCHFGHPFQPKAARGNILDDCAHRLALVLNHTGLVDHPTWRRSPLR